MQIKHKKGVSFSLNQIASVVLGVIGVVFLIYLSFQIFSPNFDKQAKTTENYLERFKETIDLVDEQGNASFKIIQSNEDNLIYLVYFAREKIAFFPEFDGKRFEIKDSKQNNVCFCYFDENEKSVCENCLSLSEKGNYVGISLSGKWVIGLVGGLNIEISKQENGYVFEPKKDGRYFFDTT